VGTIADLLKMQKNVCVSRHFQQLNKEFAASQNSGYGAFTSRPASAGAGESRKSFLDVWLVDFLAPTGRTDISDTTSLFTLQLACIGMSPREYAFPLKILSSSQ